MKFFSAIVNRAFEPAEHGWSECLHKGEFPHSCGILQVIDDQSFDSIVANFKTDRQQRNHPGLLIDRDHFSADPDKPSDAMGWIIDLRRDGDSLLARVDWTTQGEQALRSGSYRLLSPVFRHEDLQDLGNGRKRPLRLDGAGLTNVPNMRGMMPLSNRAPSSDNLTPAQIEQLSPTEAGARVQAICNRLKTEKNWNFMQAWEHVQITFPALFNRIAPTRQPSASSSGVAGYDLTRAASDALVALAERERRESGRSFAESHQTVSNRNPQLVCLTNRGAAETGDNAKWAEWKQIATRQFCGGVSPDGNLVTRKMDRSSREKVEQQIYGSYMDAKQKYPGLTPSELLEKVREINPANYWAWVAMTAAAK